MADEQNMAIDPARFARLLEVVSLASIGEYALALDRFGALCEDDLGMLEEGMRIFISELKSGHEAREQATDALERARAELEQKLTLIEAQRQEIRALSTPILDVWGGVLAVPLVGAIDHARALEITEKLLQRVVETRTRWTLLDLTGVDAVDETTADHLVKLARAVKLVGAHCVVTGLSPATAHAFASLGQGLGDLRCLPTLREGLGYCLATARGTRR
jgi:rsbT co-antagonist protein RsbR